MKWTLLIYALAVVMYSVIHYKSEEWRYYVGAISLFLATVAGWSDGYNSGYKSRTRT